MYQNDPILWSYAAQDREQALLQDAEDYRRVKRAEANQPGPARYARRVAALSVTLLVVVLIAWMVVAA